MNLLKAIFRTERVLYVLVALVFPSLQAANVRFYGLTKGQSYVQANTAAPVLATTSAYDFHAFVELASPGTVSSATLKWPGAGPTKSLTNETTAWRYRERFVSS